MLRAALCQHCPGDGALHQHWALTEVSCSNPRAAVTD